MMSGAPEQYSNEELEQYDKQYVWHPFTQMKDYLAETPLIIESGKGSWLQDIYGDRYLDGVSSLWVTVHGHRRRDIDSAIRRQLGQVAHSTLLGLANVPSILLAKRLVETSPQGLNKVFYSDSGATAVEIALKMAFQYWQQRGEGQPNRTKYVCFKNGYHGDTVGSVSVGGIDLFHEVYRPLLFETFKVESPYCYRCFLGLEFPSCELECTRQLNEVLGRHSNEIVALIIEPMIQAAGGMLVFPPEYLRTVRDLCTRYNVLMIADEVATGFGRTGKMFACEHEDVRPDLMAVGKGITGGYLPLAATLATDEIYNGFLGEHTEQKTLFHGHTYTGNPLACAAAVANLDVFEKDRTLDKMSRKIRHLERLLRPFHDLPHVGEVRQLGFMVGIELVTDKESREAYPYEDRIGIQVILEARGMGLVIRPLDNVIVLMPSLSVSRKELKQIVEITYEAIRQVTE